MKVVVLGQGYVGLPLALRSVMAGHDVVGFDVDQERIANLTAARTYIEDITDADLRGALATGRFTPSADPALLTGFDVAVISVPTPLRQGTPDLRFIESAGEMLGPHVTPGSCVILESTTYPGTTQDVLIPLLERASGLCAGPDFAVGYSPERIDPGNQQWQLHNTPKIVSGIDDASLQAVDKFFCTIVERTVPTAGVKEAELAKLLENTFRHVNIALVNELAIYAHGLGIDVWSVIDAAATKPFGFMRFTPGPGVGGHCLPIDPSYLSWQVRQTLGHSFRFVELANDVNEHMPDYVASRVTEHLNRRRLSVNGSKILLLGLAYKSNSGDARESPAIAVADRLHSLGAELVAVDDMIDERHVPEFVQLVTFAPELLRSADMVVVLTDHDSVDWAAIAEVADRVLDTRNRISGAEVDRL
jgi:UDP-N-acetyl-D-glucosamine dehydrogenase